MDHHHCPSGNPDCAPSQLCAVCYAHALITLRAQARGIGSVWAERICRGELRTKRWSEIDEAKANPVARRRVAHLATDSRMLDELAAECLAGVGQWWDWRPRSYRQ